jgi:hypothetical protein
VAKRLSGKCLSGKAPQWQSASFAKRLSGKELILTKFNKNILLQSYDQDLNITKQLLTEEEEQALDNCAEENGDIMDEMERLMTKMENVFATFKDPTLVKKTMPMPITSQTNLGSTCPETDPAIIGQLVAEISDQIHAQIYKKEQQQ